MFRLKTLNFTTDFSAHCIPRNYEKMNNFLRKGIATFISNNANLTLDVWTIADFSDVRWPRSQRRKTRFAKRSNNFYIDTVDWRILTLDFPRQLCPYRVVPDDPLWSAVVSAAHNTIRCWRPSAV